MPLPIKPVHSLDLHAELFDGPSMEGLGLSDIQIQLLGVSQQPKKAEAAKLSNRYIDMLRAIDASTDEVVTAASQLALNKDGKVCSVPNVISDNDLLALKTAGLLTGYGRSVELTEKAKLALRDHYLSIDNVNEFRKQRTKDRFDLDAARSVNASSNRFKKVGSWLTSNKFRDEFNVRFVANNDKLRTKGLMFAEPLEDFEVVIFEFDYPDCYSFWNKNVSFPLSLAFLDEKYRIRDIKDMEADDPKSVYPESSKIVFVVEANKGTFENLGIKIGDKLTMKGNKLVLDKENK